MFNSPDDYAFESETTTITDRKREEDYIERGMVRNKMVSFSFTSTSWQFILKLLAFAENWILSVRTKPQRCHIQHPQYRSKLNGNDVLPCWALEWAKTVSKTSSVAPVITSYLFIISVVMRVHTADPATHKKNNDWREEYLIAVTGQRRWSIKLIKTHVKRTIHRNCA